jgi:hypothetical protein
MRRSKEKELANLGKFILLAAGLVYMVLVLVLVLVVPVRSFTALLLPIEFLIDHSGRRNG